MNVFGLLISLLGGAVVGNLAGALMRDKNLGAIGNTFAGLLGGGLGGGILESVGIFGADPASGGLDIWTVFGYALGGGAGAVVVMAIIAALRASTAKRV